jgi:hypothetical protein
VSGRNARAGLSFLYRDDTDRVGRDRREILTALIAGPSFDPIFRPDVIEIPRQHPIYRWECAVDHCERSRSGGSDLCPEHLRQWARERESGVGKAAFLSAATGLQRHVRVEELACRVCPQRPVAHTELRLCQRHLGRWQYHEKTNGALADLAAWLAEQLPLPGYGSCRVAVCTNLADSPLGLCPWHTSRYYRDKRPGRAGLPSTWWHRFEQFGRPVPIDYADEAAFHRCPSRSTCGVCGRWFARRSNGACSFTRSGPGSTTRPEASRLAVGPRGKADRQCKNVRPVVPRCLPREPVRRHGSRMHY